jgi:methylthioribose-1-phosphate isomerase
VRLTGDGAAVRIIDQRLLPTEFVEVDLDTLDEVVDAISSLAVRGAPAIGVCAAAGLAMSMLAHEAAPRHAFIAALRTNAERLATARPTAVNLRWALDRAVHAAEGTTGDGRAMRAALVREARAIRDDDLAMSAAIARNALTLLVAEPIRVLTHCNTGALATAGAGTALAPVLVAHAAGRRVEVFATETRPLLQGARLTAWELQRAGVPVTVLADGASAALMRTRAVDAVIVGADRIAANGDVANKVGTYALAVAALHHGIPFYVCAPWSTIDVATPDGNAIPIEMRGRDELAKLGMTRVLPDGVPAWTPAFDITPASLVSAIVTDRGIHRAPFALGAAART